MTDPETKPAAWRHRGPKGGWITTEAKQPWSEQALYDATTIERLTAERDEAREALKPFAALYDESMRDFPDGSAKRERPDDMQAWGFNNVDLTWGDFRRAHSATESSNG